MPFLKEDGVPTKAKSLLTCRVTKRCCTMVCQVSIWTGRRKIKKSKNLQKPLKVVLKKINSLTSYYSQLRQKYAASKNKSGNGPDDVKKQLGLTMGICGC